MPQISAADVAALGHGGERGLGAEADAETQGYVLPPLLWSQIKQKLKPAEVPEFKRVLGVDQIIKNKELHVEASALAEIYTEYCRDSQISIRAVYEKRASMPQPQAHGLLLNEIAMLVDKLQSSQLGNSPAGSARPSTPLEVKSISQDRQQMLWRLLQKDGSPGRRPGSAESPSAASRLRTSRRPDSRESAHRVKMLFGAVDADGEQSSASATKKHKKDKKREKKEKKREKKDKREKKRDRLDSSLGSSAGSSGRPPVGPGGAGVLGLEIDSSRPASRDYFSSRPSTAAARPPSSQRPTSTASAPADIGSPGGLGFSRLNLPSALGLNTSGSDTFSLEMDDKSVVALREALEAEVGVLCCVRI